MKMRAIFHHFFTKHYLGLRTNFKLCGLGGKPTQLYPIEDLKSGKEKRISQVKGIICPDLFPFDSNYLFSN